MAPTIIIGSGRNRRTYSIPEKGRERFNDVKNLKLCVARPDLEPTHFLRRAV